MLQWKHGACALDIKSIADFWILQNFNSCAIHEEEVGTLSLGTLYIIMEKMHALQSPTETLPDALFTVFLNTEYWKHTMYFGKGEIHFLFSCMFLHLHLTPFNHTKVIAHAERLTSSSVAVTTLKVQKYYKLCLNQETGGIKQLTHSERKPKSEAFTGLPVWITTRPGHWTDMQLFTPDSCITFK